MGESFFHRSSAVFRRRTSDLLHLTICFPRIRSSQRIIARVAWELAIRRKLKHNKNKYLRNFDSFSYGSGMTARRLSTRELRIFLAVVHSRSMAKAAKTVGTSQPAISKAIADMEHSLGVRLLDRSPQGVEPTQYGRALVKCGLAVFKELNKGINDIALLPCP